MTKEFVIPKLEELLFRLKQNEISFMKLRNYEILPQKQVVEKYYENNEHYVETYNEMSEVTNTSDIYLYTSVFLRDINYIAKKNEIEFRRAMKNNYVNKKNNSKGRVEYLILSSPNAKTVSKDDITFYTGIAKEDDIDFLVLVVEKKLAKNATEGLEFIKKIMNVFFITENSFYLNPIKHQLCPPHKILSPGDSKKFINDHKSSTLPKQTPLDAVTKYHGIKKGSIVVYNRKLPGSQICDNTLYYRLA